MMIGDSCDKGLMIIDLDRVFCEDLLSGFVIIVDRLDFR